MSTETENKDVDEATAEESGPLAGERLAAARREQQITVLEVAKELHLDEPKVRALEQNDFEMLGAPVFAKGHLKKYAQLVGVSADDVLADYYALNRSSSMPPVVGRVRRPDRSISPGPWIAVIVVLIVVASAYWWFVMRQPQTRAPAEPTQVPASESPIEDSSETIDEIVTVEDDAAMPAQDVTDAPEVSEPVLLDEQPTPTPPAAGDVRLTMTFTGECWTEISDADGERLYFNLGRPGRTVSVEGSAPLSVLFGSADNVSLQVNGADYSIAAADRRGETARLTIFAP